MLVLSAASLVAAGCGGSGDDTASSTTSSTTTSTTGPVSTATTESAAASSTGPASTIEVDVDGASTTTAADAAPTEAVVPGPDEPLPASAAALADELTRAETAIRDPAVDDEAAAAWGRHQQRLYRHLAVNAEWADEALALDDPLLRRAAELNWEARVNLDALVAAHTIQSELPAWRVVAPRPAAELLGYYRDGEAQWDIDWQYLAAINLIETRMGRIEGISTAGALGPMQFLPTTWAECCEGDPTDPADAIPGAARYLTIRGGPEDMERAIWGYNNSDRYVAAVTAYAEVLRDDEAAYRGYHAWEIYFRSTEGLIHLPVGYEELAPVPAADWLAANPDRRIDG